MKKYGKLRVLPVIIASLVVSACGQEDTNSTEITENNDSEIEIAALEPAAGRSKRSCSKRYRRSYDYKISSRFGSRNTSPSYALKDWEISKSWGIKENVKIVNSSGRNTAIKVYYPEDSINPGNKNAPLGGTGFYAHAGFKEKEEAACLTYKVRFQKGFKFAKGGKLPGLYGGNNFSGCAKDAGKNGFSTRYMWRESGKGSVYAYTPNKKTRCGAYIGKGSWYFKPGVWHTIEQEVVLNKPGKKNGAIKVWVDGENVINRTSEVLRTSSNVDIDGIFFNTFFGGSSTKWASPKNQSAEFRDFKVSFPR